MTLLKELEIPGYVVGSWSIDPAHSYVGVVVRHSMLSRVRGQFERVRGEIVTAQDVFESNVDVTIDVASLHTDDETRDADVRSARFMDAEHFPTMTFTSTGVATSTGIGRMYAFLIEGDLTIKGVTRSVVVQATTPQFGLIPERGMSMGISGHTLIHRSEFGVDLNPGIPGGGFLVSDDVEVTLEVEATLEP